MKNSVEEILCGLLARELFGAEYVPPSDTDWHAVYDEACVQAVIIPAFLGCGDYDIPEAVKEKIRNAVFAATNSNIYANNCHAWLAKLLKKNSVPYCILKGSASAAYYPSPFMRIMGDVDFIVRKEDFDRTAELLKSQGLRFNSGNDKHDGYTNGRILFEMHRCFSPGKDAKNTEIIDGYMSSVIDTAKQYESNGLAFCVPDVFHHGLIMLLHCQRHLVGCGGIGMRHLCDWAVFVNSPECAEFPEIFEQKLRKIGLWNFAVTLSLAAVTALKMPRREWMGNDTKLAEDLVKNILMGGNFARKSPTVGYEQLFMNVDGKAQRSVLLYLFLGLNQTVYAHWPAAKKYKILLPAGWIYFPLRRLFLLVVGKRRYENISEIVDNSKFRRNLYDELRLFEVDPD